MEPISLLLRESSLELTPEEEAALARELSEAYHMDEAAITSREVQRITEKVRHRLSEASSREAVDQQNNSQ